MGAVTLLVVMTARDGTDGHRQRANDLVEGVGLVLNGFRSGTFSLLFPNTMTMMRKFASSRVR